MWDGRYVWDAQSIDGLPNDRWFAVIYSEVIIVVDRNVLASSVSGDLCYLR